VPPITSTQPASKQEIVSPPELESVVEPGGGKALRLGS
jgi:hypothetical protein